MLERGAKIDHAPLHRAMLWPAITMLSPLRYGCGALVLMRTVPLAFVDDAIGMLMKFLPVSSLPVEVRVSRHRRRCLPRRWLCQPRRLWCSTPCRR